MARRRDIVPTLSLDRLPSDEPGKFGFWASVLLTRFRRMKRGDETGSEAKVPLGRTGGRKDGPSSGYRVDIEHRRLAIG